MSKLLTILYAETKEFFEDFKLRVTIAAEKEYEKAAEMAEWNSEKWCSFLGIAPIEKTTPQGQTYRTFPAGFFNTAQSKKYFKYAEKARAIYKKGRIAHILKAQKSAEDHYNNATLKLEDRLLKIGVNQDTLTVKSGKVGVNLELVLSDGKNIVRAYTIIASGPIQKPHYRYLVK